MPPDLKYSFLFKQDLSVFKDKYIMSDDEWKLLCDGLNRLGDLAKELDIKLVYHHHMSTVVQTEAEIDRLMKAGCS